jgi:hypothetical protein
MSATVNEMLQHVVKVFEAPENQQHDVLPISTINTSVMKIFKKSINKKNISLEGGEFGLMWAEINSVKYSRPIKADHKSQESDVLRSLRQVVDIFKANMNDHMLLADVNSQLKLMSVHPLLDADILNEMGGPMGFSLVDDKLYWSDVAVPFMISSVGLVEDTVPTTLPVGGKSVPTPTDLILDISQSEVVEFSRTLNKTDKDMELLTIALFRSRKLLTMPVNAIRSEFQKLGPHAKTFGVTKNIIENVGREHQLYWEPNGSNASVVWKPLASVAGHELNVSGLLSVKSTRISEAPAPISATSKIRQNNRVSSIARAESSSSFAESNGSSRSTPQASNASNSVFSHFYGRRHSSGEEHVARDILVDEMSYQSGEVKGGYFGDIIHTGVQERPLAFLNVVEPFSLVCVGRQGTGKSHTLNVVLENCIVNYPEPAERPITRMTTQMCGLVLHFDQSDSNVCEALGLHDMAPSLKILSNESFHGAKNVVVLVSPNYHLQRRKFYEGLPHVTVKTLRFQWSSLDASQLKKLMRLDASDSQLYVSLMLSQLGGYQARNELPDMEEFFSAFEKRCSPEQQRPLLQRLNLLRSVVSQHGEDDTCAEPSSLMEPGAFIVCDLTDPMLSEAEVNAIFQVLLQQFRRQPLRDCGKVVVFDEAHKYLSTDTKSDCLSKDIVATVRQMRHENIRVLLSTQSPLHLPAEVIELSTVVIMHEFQSKDWYKYVESKLSLPAGGFETVKNLRRGHALLCSNKIMRPLLSIPQTDDQDEKQSESVIIQVRERITTDCGRSMTHY